MQLRLTNTSPKRKFLNSINYFRGLAIILIVLGHSYDLSHWEISNIWEKTIYSLSQNGSVFFLFISGFLFHHIFYSRFNYKKFMISKVKNVFLPYLLISIIPILMTVFFLNGGENLPTELQDKPLISIVWYLVTGNVILAYWYIPVAMILYALSPLVIWLINSQNLLKAILFLLPISLIVHRPIDNINTLQSTIYFFPIYLLGVWSSRNKKKIYQYLNNKRTIILGLAIVLAAIQSLFFEIPGNFHKPLWIITVPDINLIQKILLVFFFMSFLDLHEKSDLKILNKTAETSFPLYFIHPLLINVAAKLIDDLNLDYQGNLFTLILTALILLSVSMAIACGIKTIFQKNSRYLIGW
jgi:peptidoglycan/LPS O-acetylase OafA/YrhL